MTQGRTSPEETLNIASSSKAKWAKGSLKDGPDSIGGISILESIVLGSSWTIQIFDLGQHAGPFSNMIGSTWQSLDQPENRGGGVN